MTGKGVAPVEELIVTIRGQRVILAADLARIYGVQTRVLNQAVKRNREKFPADFTYQITRDEAQEVQRLRSQIVILKPGQHLKYLPYAFTEHGAIMAANVLNSPRAVQMSVFAVWSRVRLRVSWVWSTKGKGIASDDRIPCVGGSDPAGDPPPTGPEGHIGSRLGGSLWGADEGAKAGG